MNEAHCITEIRRQRRALLIKRRMPAILYLGGVWQRVIRAAKEGK